MTTKKDETFRIYLKALLAVRKIIEEEYVNGGWLPAERKMSEKLGVSRVTYRKLLSWLLKENLVRSVPRKGHWVLEESRRCNKIGIVIGHATESPFLGEGNFLSTVLNRLKVHSYSAHLIQASRLENIYISAMSHAVKGLIWLTPPPEALDPIKTIQKSKTIPLMLLMQKPIGSKADLKNIAYVAMDFEAATKHAAESLIEHGHHQVAFASSCEDDCNRKFKQAFKNAKIKFGDDQIITDLETLESQFTELFKKKEIKTVLSGGGIERIEMLFNACMTLPINKRPKILLPKQLAYVAERYEGLDVIGFQTFLGSEIADPAIDTLIDHIKTGKKMKSTLLQAYNIEWRE